MAPELFNTIEANELRELAAKVEAYRESKKISNNELYRKFGGIGSTTTFQRILQGNLKELDLEKQLSNYRSVVALIETIGNDIEDEEHILDRMVGPIELRRAFLEASTQASIARFILVQGDTGTGKTFTLKSLASKYGGRCFMIEAAQSWNDRPNAMLSAFLLALGVKEQPAAAHEKERLLVDRLRETRRAALMDEFHHLGPACLNSIKTLINQTPGEFIGGAMATLWNRLERASYQEVKQLTGNRLAERIQLHLHEADVAKYVDDRIVGLKDAEIEKAVALLMEYAPQRANLAFVRNVCRHARRAAEQDPMTLEIFTVAVKQEVNRR